MRVYYIFSLKTALVSIYRQISIMMGLLAQAIMCMHVQLLSHVQLFVTPWAVAHQVPLSMGRTIQSRHRGPAPRLESLYSLCPRMLFRRSL